LFLILRLRLGFSLLSNAIPTCLAIIYLANTDEINY
jgi:hypothetical protein